MERAAVATHAIGTPRVAARPQDEPSSEPRRWSWPALSVIIGLAVFAFVMSFVVAAALFPHQSVNNDEAVYVFQAKTMLHGHLTLPAQDLQDFFRPWMSGEHNGRQVMVFQPVFPATLAASEWLFGTMRVAPAAIAAGCVLLVAVFTRETLRDERTAVAAAALLALSPFVIIQSGMYLEYLYAVLLELATLILVLRGRRRQSTRHLIGAGAALGLLFFMRPLDAILIGAALAVYVALDDRHDARRAGRTVGWGAVGALPFVVMCFAYNRMVTGSALRFPLWIIGGSNEFGFGKRYIVNGAPVMNISFGKALEALRVNLRAFPHWNTGGLVALPLVLYGLWKLRRHRITVLLVAIAVIVPLGYLFYWGNVLIMYGRKFFGPHYYMSLLIPASVVVGHALVQLFDHRRKAVYLTCAALITATAIEVPDKVDHNQRATNIAIDEDNLLRETVTDRAIVLLPRSRDGMYVLHPRGWLMNRPDLKGRVLYAVDRSEQNVELFDRYPDRSVYRLQQTEGSTTGSPFRPNVRRLNRRDVGPTTATVTAMNGTGAAVTILYANLGLNHIECVVDRASVIGKTYSETVRVEPDAVTLQCPDGQPRLARTDPRATLSIGIGIGPNDDIGQAQLHEYRYWCLSHGNKLSVIDPPEQWRRDSAPSSRWRVTDGNPSIAVTLS